MFTFFPRPFFGLVFIIFRLLLSHTNLWPSPRHSAGHCDPVCSSPSTYTRRNRSSSARDWWSASRPAGHVAVCHPAAPVLHAPSGSPRWGSRPPGTSDSMSRRRRRLPSESVECMEDLWRNWKWAEKKEPAGELVVSWGYGAFGGM